MTESQTTPYTFNFYQSDATTANVPSTWQAAPVAPVPLPEDFAYVRLYFREGEKTPDGRVIDPNAVNFNRPPPFSIRLQTTQPESGGHAGAVVCGVITQIARDGLTIICDGRLDLKTEAGRQALELISSRTMQTWSPDLGDAVIDTEENVDDEDADIQSGQGQVDHFISATFLGATLVAMPALASAVVELLDSSGNVLVPAPDREGLLTEPVGVSHDPSQQRYIVNREETEIFAWDGSSGRFNDQQWKRACAACDPASKGTVKERCFLPHHEPGGAVNPDGVRNALSRLPQLKNRAPSAVAAARSHLQAHARQLKIGDHSEIAACAGPANPPAAFFEDPELHELQRFISVTADGRVYGHLAGWGECHIGFPERCIEVPASSHEYAYFRIGQVLTAEGTLVPTGVLAVKGGHAPRDFSAEQAQAHYDDTDTAVADVAIGEDDHGVWFSGSLRPNVTEEQVRTLRASGVSGDWRRIEGSLELIGACSVNVPGFPKASVRLAASADGEEEVLALIAAGGAPQPAEDCDCSSEMEERITYLESIIASYTDKQLEDMENELLAAAGGQYNDGACRLGGWQWTDDEVAAFANGVKNVIPLHPSQHKDLANLLGGWRWSRKKNPLHELTSLLDSYKGNKGGK